jgi:hypothetical protein
VLNGLLLKKKSSASNIELFPAPFLPIKAQNFPPVEIGINVIFL